MKRFNIFLRWFLLLPALIISAPLVRGLASVLEALTGIWQEYTLSILLPGAALWIVALLAPRARFTAALFMFGTLIAVGLVYVFPAYYPDWHPSRAEPTYIPFVLLLLSGLLNLLAIKYHAGR